MTTMKLRAKIQMLQQYLKWLESDGNSVEAADKDADYLPPLPAATCLTLDQLPQKRRLELRTTKNRIGPFEVRVKTATITLVVNHDFSRRQVSAAVKILSTLLGFDVDAPSIAAISRWRKAIVALTS